MHDPRPPDAESLTAAPDLLDLFPHPAWRADADGRWVLFNQGWLAFTGRTSAEELEKGWLLGVHPEDLDRVLRAFQQGFQAQAPFHQEFRLRHVDGSHHWIDNHVYPMRSSHGDCLGYVGSCYDLSAARMVEARALRLGQLYEALCRINRIARLNPSSDVLFEAACQVVVDVGRFCLAWVGLLDPVSRLITPVAVHGTLRGLEEDEARKLLAEAKPSTDPDAPGGKGLTGQACREARFAVSNDLQADPRMHPWLALVKEWDVRASAAFPLIVRGQVRGALAIYAVEAGAFDSEVVDLLERVAEDLSLAIERLEQSRRWSEVEGRLRASERLFSATLDTLTASLAVLDETGKVLAVNSAWTEFDHVGNPLVQGIAPGDDYRALCSRLLSEGGLHADFAYGTLEVLAGGEGVFTGEYPGEGAGSTRWYAATVSRFAYEGLQRVVLAHREITDRKLAEDRLRQSETLFRMITENAVDLITLLDSEGRRLYASPSYLTVLGYSSAELSAQNPLELVEEQDRDHLRAAFQMISDERCDAATVEYRLVRKDGTLARVEARIAAIRGGNGGEAKILVVARDISEREAAEQARRHMEAELAQAQKLESIGQLAAGIAHEINTPTQYVGDNLRFIQETTSELLDLLEALPPPGAGEEEAAPGFRAFRERLAQSDLDYLREELPKAACQSLEGVARISKIVGALKEFSHPDSEAKTLADLNRAIESTVAISRNEWKYVADLDLDLDPDLPSLPCHPGGINQVVLNLVVNAAHAIGEVVGHSGQKGRITVRTRVEGDRVVIQVEDTGAGIPEAVRGRIFDPFFTTKDVGKGSGQGLAIARSVVVDKHGGTIGFESEPGQGTIFTIHLPLIPDRPDRDAGIA
jgi:PAS domain S-box-containing protein